MYRKRVGAGALVAQSPGTIVLGGRAVSLAVDSAGNAGVAFFVAAANNSADLAFWRPGSPPAVVASADGLDLTATTPPQDHALGLAHLRGHHAAPRLPPAQAGRRRRHRFLVPGATDSGRTWSAPVGIPRNGSALGTHSTQNYQAIAIGPGNRVSIAAPWSAVGTATNCLGPKLARSTDGLKFTTCSPMGSPIQRREDWMTMWSHKAGKETIVFSYDNAGQPQMKAGITVWREP